MVEVVVDGISLDLAVDENISVSLDNFDVTGELTFTDWYVSEIELANTELNNRALSINSSDMVVYTTIHDCQLLIENIPFIPNGKLRILDISKNSIRCSIVGGFGGKLEAIKDITLAQLWARFGVEDLKKIGSFDAKYDWFALRDKKTISHTTPTTSGVIKNEGLPNIYLEPTVEEELPTKYAYNISASNFTNTAIVDNSIPGNINQKVVCKGRLPINTYWFDAFEFLDWIKSYAGIGGASSDIDQDNAFNRSFRFSMNRPFKEALFDKRVDSPLKNSNNDTRYPDAIADIFRNEYKTPILTVDSWFSTQQRDTDERKYISVGAPDEGGVYGLVVDADLYNSFDSGSYYENTFFGRNQPNVYTSSWNLFSRRIDINNIDTDVFSVYYKMTFELVIRIDLGSGGSTTGEVRLIIQEGASPSPEDYNKVLFTYDRRDGVGTQVVNRSTQQITRFLAMDNPFNPQAGLIPNNAFIQTNQGNDALSFGGKQSTATVPFGNSTFKLEVLGYFPYHVDQNSDLPLNYRSVSSGYGSIIKSKSEIFIPGILPEIKVSEFIKWVSRFAILVPSIRRAENKLYFYPFEFIPNNDKNTLDWTAKRTEIVKEGYDSEDVNKNPLLRPKNYRFVNGKLNEKRVVLSSDYEDEVVESPFYDNIVISYLRVLGAGSGGELMRSRYGLDGQKIDGSICLGLFPAEMASGAPVVFPWSEGHAYQAADRFYNRYISSFSRGFFFSERKYILSSSDLAKFTGSEIIHDDGANFMVVKIKGWDGKSPCTVELVRVS